MRRLAMTAALGVIAFAVPGTAPSSGASRWTTSRPDAVRRTASGSSVPALPFALQRQIEGPPPPTDHDFGRSAVLGSSRASRGGERSTDAVWAALANCESNGNGRAVSDGGRYFGAFQFSLATWHSLGYAGSPAEHSYAEQVDAAKRLQQRSGWSQWPACARHLGLR